MAVRWVCPKCGWRYETPSEADTVKHLCQSTSKLKYVNLVREDKVK